ncbi:tagatose 1,6-diphosphate aldolase [uncultured Nitratireductor sp.]|uniref:tagatose 1,6-diphosphate aldolase n=1 Tax=uncultured Nitratireductor sp. TaxID=520953 RepID=UPI0025D4A0AC|nr:tagatose 1,6-diphosphate aldolase [uncultured Nitratireductor sp.]
MSVSAGKYWGLRRMADSAGRFKMTAVDQRPPIKNPIAKARGTAEAPYDDVARFKRLLVETLQEQSTALLLDPHFAYPRAIDVLSPRKGMILTLEDSVFDEVPGGRLSSEIDNWSVGKIKRAGGDAVKVLAWYRPDAAPEICRAQQEFTRRIGEACARYDIPFLFELLVYPLASDAEQTRDYVEMKTKRADHVLASVEEFARPEYQIDVFKLESPIAAGDLENTAIDTAELFREMGQLAGRPWVMLSAGAGKPEFEAILKHAYAAGASGYLAGRAIWLDAFAHFPDWNRIEDGLRGDAVAYMQRINRLTDQHARPWFDHPRFGGQKFLVPDDAGFRASYPDFENG